VRMFNSIIPPLTPPKGGESTHNPESSE